MSLTKRQMMLGFGSFMGLSVGRAGYKCTRPIKIRTERSKIFLQYPLLYKENEPYKNETRPLLLTEKANCVFVSLFTTIYRFPEDLQALEIIARGESDPEKFNLENHPFFRRTYERVQDFIIS